MSKEDSNIDLVKLNEEQMKLPHKLLSMQNIMLLDQYSNPTLPMHNVSRLFRYNKNEIDINKFQKCSNMALKHHPILLTVLHKNSDDSVVQIYKPELFKEIIIEKLNENDFLDLANKGKLLTPFQFNLFDSLLINFRLFETEKYIYQYLDFHHIVIDLYGMWLIQNSIEKYYNDLVPEDDYYFYYLKQIEDIVCTDEYKDIKNIYKEKYGKGLPCGSPCKDKDCEGIKGLDFYCFTINNLSTKLKVKFNDNSIIYNAFFVMASMCAIAKDNNKSDIMVSWTYHGRDSKISKNIVGNFGRIYPVRYTITKKEKIKNFAESIIKQCKDLLKIKYYPYLFEYEYDVDIMNDIFQKDFNNKITKFNGFDRTKIDLPIRDLNSGIFINQVIDAVYSVLDDDTIQMEWQYPFCKFKVETMDRFRDLFIKYCFKLVEYWDSDEEINIFELVH